MRAMRPPHHAIKRLRDNDRERRKKEKKIKNEGTNPDAIAPT